MDWAADVLPGFVAAQLGPATLVRPDAMPPSPRATVLHLHGYNDYFFHAHVAAALTAAGFAFFAVDLRRAGRSLRRGDHPHDMASVREPGDDLAAAAAVIAADHPGVPLAIHAHSTGALTALVLARDRAPANLKALVLDSPLFGRVLTRGQRVSMRALPAIAATWPHAIVSRTPSVYARTLHVSGGGDWDFDTRLKRPQGVPVTAQWLAEVTRVQRRIGRGLGLELPVLVARSDSSGPERDDNPRLREQDVVVDVAAAARLTPRIGPLARELVIPGGIHDLTLSAPAPRAAYLEGVTTWLRAVLP